MIRNKISGKVGKNFELKYENVINLETFYKFWNYKFYIYCIKSFKNQTKIVNWGNLEDQSVDKLQ